MTTKNEDQNNAKIMTLYEKMNLVINEVRIGKNGKNTFSNYDYFRPDEINMNVNPLFLKYRLFPYFHTAFVDYPTEQKYVTRPTLNDDSTLQSVLEVKHNYKEIAYLAIRDLDSDNFMEYQMPLELPEIKGANVMQRIRRFKNLCKEIFNDGGAKYSR